VERGNRPRREAIGRLLQQTNAARLHEASVGPVVGPPPQPPGDGYRERAPEGPVPMPSLVHFAVFVLVSASAASLFRYLRHRDYLKTARYLCDQHGLPALRAFLELTAGGEVTRPAADRSRAAQSSSSLDAPQS
jgi:hypothetical protein